MGSLFGKSKKKESRVTEQDKAVLVIFWILLFTNVSSEFLCTTTCNIIFSEQNGDSLDISLG